MTGEAVNADSFRRAWSCFGTGVTVITTPEPGGSNPGARVHGMTANGVVSVSLEPPLALVSVGHNRNSYPLIKANGRFAISILSADQEAVARHFTKPPEERDPDDGIPFAELGESLVIDGALAAMDCRVVAEHEEGDHTLFIAEVEHVRLGKGEPMLWYQGRFGRFAAGQAGDHAISHPGK
ncbi:MAG: flavin reductase family protein [Chloroflexi bacterium]|nr:flavin reductase family protein [Chloroflexota bacterium]